MPSETNTTTAGELVGTEIIERLIYDAAYDFGVVAPLVRTVSIADGPSNTAEFPKWPLISATDLTEGTDMANTAINPTSTTVTADEAGVMITLTDMLVNADILGGIEPYAALMGRAVGAKRDSDLAAEFADFSRSVGATGVNLSEANFLEAIYELENGVAAEEIACILHPIQAHDLRSDIVSSAGAVWGASGGPSSVVTRRMGMFFNVPTFTSTNCASINTDADRQGAMFPVGDACGIVYVQKRQVYLEPERKASLRGTQLVCVEVYGDECANTAANGGVKIVSDHE